VLRQVGVVQDARLLISPGCVVSIEFPRHLCHRICVSMVAWNPMIAHSRGFLARLLDPFPSLAGSADFDLENTIVLITDATTWLAAFRSTSEPWASYHVSMCRIRQAALRHWSCSWCTATHGFHRPLAWLTRRSSMPRVPADWQTVTVRLFGSMTKVLIKVDKLKALDAGLI